MYETIKKRSRKMWLVAALSWMGVLAGVVCLACLTRLADRSASGSLAAANPGQPGELAELEQLLHSGMCHGGLAVVVGSSKLDLAIQLARRGGYVVQILAKTEHEVAEARKQLDKQGLYGQITVELLTSEQLPYADNLVNLLFVDAEERLSEAEVQRVLTPEGLFIRCEGDRWRVQQKARPDNIDSWTHFLHDASNNPVANDLAVGPPRRLQWVADPPFTRSHEHTPSIFALVTDGKRIYYIADEGAIHSVRKPARWHLVCRDAFNGLVIWKKALRSWYPHLINWGQTYSELQRRLVVADGKVFVTLGFWDPVTVLDAATGEELLTVSATEGAQELVYQEGILLVHSREPTPEAVREYERFVKLIYQDGSPLFKRETAEPFVREFRSSLRTGQHRIMALEVESGRVLWMADSRELAGLRGMTLCASEDLAFYQVQNRVVCRDLGGGAVHWSAEAPPLRLIHGDKVICVGNDRAVVLSLRDGKELWSVKPALLSVRDVFAIGEQLWLGGFRFTPNVRSPAWGPYYVCKYDISDGRLLAQFESENPRHHHRCYQNKATRRYIIAGRRGAEFIDLVTGEYLWHNWVRGVCRYGIMPANGLLYAPPHACACYLATRTVGFTALASGPIDPCTEPVENRERLHKGPAWNTPIEAVEPAGSSWPTYRCDSARSGFTVARLPAELHQSWQQQVGAVPTAPTIGSGLVFVALPEKCQLVALDVANGTCRWRFTTASPIDSPPTVYGGRVIFGCRDGYVYCLRANDGQLVWKFHAAYEDRQLVASRHLESAWPVFGSVLLHEGRLYAVAGRTSYLDGGLFMYCLEPSTGRLLATYRFYSPDPKTGKQPPQYGPASMPGERNDILTAQDDLVFLRDAAFDLQCRPAGRTEPHLFTLTDFLDTSWPHRSYWIFGTRCSIACGCAGRDKNLIYGRLICFDRERIFGFGRKTVHWSNHLEDGPYALWARNRQDGSLIWSVNPEIAVRAMVVAGDKIFAAGPTMRAFFVDNGEASRTRAKLVVFSCQDGQMLTQYDLPGVPVFDGMAATTDGLFVALQDGSVLCFEPLTGAAN